MDEKELNKAMEMPAGLQNLGINTQTPAIIIFGSLIDNGPRC
jgi:hypothetical protein